MLLGLNFVKTAGFAGADTDNFSFLSALGWRSQAIRKSSFEKKK